MKGAVIWILFAAALDLVSGQTLILGGGGLDDYNEEFWNTVINEMGGVDNARIGIISTASDTPEETALSYQDLFENIYGVKSTTWIPVTELVGANDAANVDLIRQQTGFFLTGGDQERIIKGFKNSDGSDSDTLKALRTFFENGGVLSGSSAGTACMASTPMITGGLSYDALRYGAYDGGYNPDYPDDLSYAEDGGLGFLDNYILDTHFSPRGREGRLTRLLMDTTTLRNGATRGIGIDENMGLIIRNVGSSSENAEVLGDEGGIVIIDISQANFDPAVHTNVNNVKISFLTEDDTYNMVTSVVTPASWKVPLEGEETYGYAVSSADIFSSPYKPLRDTAEFRRVATNLFDSWRDNQMTSYTYEKNPQFDVTMSKTGAKSYHNFSPTTQVHQITYINMDVTMVG